MAETNDVPWVGWVWAVVGLGACAWAHLLHRLARRAVGRSTASRF